LLRSALDTRLRDVDDLAAVSGLPVLASFPKLPSDTRRLPNEAISYLRTNLLFSMAEAQPKVILVTSSSASEGKSSVSLSLAESFVRNNYRTLLVDADLRKPVIAGEYRISQDRKVTPLERWLRNPYGPNQPAIIPIGGRYTLNVIPSFEPTAQAAELLSAGFRESLDSWRKEYDVIIIDSAPVLAVADTLTIAPLCTGTLLVANQQKTDRRQVRAMVELLKRIGVRMIGVVATHVSREASQGTGYGYGYGNIDENELKKTIIPEAVTATKLTNSGR
jgi:capsular exopolysaccharide synthesis family protein